MAVIHFFAVSILLQIVYQTNTTLSHNSKFHAIFATSSIPEAINYYCVIKDASPDLKVTALFDPNIDNNGGAVYKEEGNILR